MPFDNCPRNESIKVSSEELSALHQDLYAYKREKHIAKGLFHTLMVMHKVCDTSAVTRYTENVQFCKNLNIPFSSYALSHKEQTIQIQIQIHSFVLLD